MFASPFGEKFRFRTPLSVDQCKARIDELTDVSLFDTNFSDNPVTVRQRGTFWLYGNKFGEPPSLRGKIETNRGWTEVVGRGGSNLFSFWAAVSTLVGLVALGYFVWLAERDPVGISLVVGSPLASLYVYWRYWEDPGAGKLIDYLQTLLEAEPVPEAPNLVRPT
jgi:hypothetical protein